MFIRLAASALALALAVAPAAAHDTGYAHSHVKDRKHAHPDADVIYKTIRISCYRGPFRVTAWDHPQPVFVDDLVKFGYEYADANAIGNRVCKDMAAIGDTEQMKQNLLNAIAETPPGH